MASVTACPACGEAEELRGTPVDDDIQVTCLKCRAQWMRGGRRCVSCGGQDIVRRPQAMTRHSRGTQLSIIGWRELPLCRTCDAAALETSISQNVPVPSDYVAVCLGAAAGRDPVVDTAPPAAPTTRAPVAPTTQAPVAGPVPTPEARPDEAPREAATPRAAPRPRPCRSKAAPSPAAVPTVRQAIAAFMAEASDQPDATAMLLLGTHLGSHERLGVLEEEGAADRLADWCRGHWGGDGDRDRRALSAICRAVDFWGARGWLVSDPAARLR
ncbi:hypothetical protein [Streptomyces sp. NPDC048392]|uniref:hypothetical protein n=1 Tax=Streptomyces sp. NPDC048392 TaxID=3365543 RepID=UPI00371E9D45